MPFHGYYFRMFTRQGSHGPGGAKDYVVDGKMTGGFAFVAYPALRRDDIHHQPRRRSDSGQQVVDLMASPRGFEPLLPP
jgi:hypothetical protein